MDRGLSYREAGVRRSFGALTFCDTSKFGFSFTYPTFMNTSTPTKPPEWLRLAKLAVETEVAAATAVSSCPISPVEMDRIRAAAILAQMSQLFQYWLRFVAGRHAFKKAGRVARGLIELDGLVKPTVPAKA